MIKKLQDTQMLQQCEANNLKLKSKALSSAGGQIVPIKPINLNSSFDTKLELKKGASHQQQSDAFSSPIKKPYKNESANVTAFEIEASTKSQSGVDPINSKQNSTSPEKYNIQSFINKVNIEDK